MNQLNEQMDYGFHPVKMNYFKGEKVKKHKRHKASKEKNNWKIDN
jgi:hypothetical protein